MKYNKNKKTMFVNYCKKHPIDMTILNKLDGYTIYNIVVNTLVFEFDNNPYVHYESKLHSYIFRFNDKKSYELLNAGKPINHSFDYDETEYIICNRSFKAVLDSEYDNAVYIFDEETKYAIISIYKDSVFVNRDITKILPNFNYKFDNIHKWKEITEVPDELKTIVNTNKILVLLKKMTT